MRVHSAAASIVSGLALCLAAADAHATPPSPPRGSTRVQEAVHTYYSGEKSGAFQFAVPGLASVAVGATLLAMDTGDVAKGAAVPMVAFGGVEVAVGLVLYLRTDALVARLDRDLMRDPSAFRAEETAHLRRVRAQFDTLLWVELTVTGVGAGLAAVGGLAKTDSVQGVGLGLALEASKHFLLDAIADERATPYLRALEAFRVSGTRDAFTMGYGARF